MTPLFTAGAVVAAAAAEWVLRKGRRRKGYAEAVERARVTGKPLLCVGDPDGGLTHGDYGYGDVCADLTGCPRAPRGIAIDLSTGSLPFEDDSHVIFSPFVLEYVPDVEHAYRELTRVAGRPEDLFLLTLGPAEAATYVYPGATWALSLDAEGRLWRKNVDRRACLRERCRLR